jgi:hypothetical protein
MEINISNEILTNIERASKELGLTEKEVVTRALILYLKNLKEYTKLQEELDELEELSFEDTNDFFETNNL